jgi:hypothetical protein
MGLALALMLKGATLHNQTLAAWHYSELPHALGCDGWFTTRVTTCGELYEALKEAKPERLGLLHRSRHRQVRGTAPAAEPRFHLYFTPASYVKRRLHADRCDGCRRRGRLLRCPAGLGRS